MLVYVVLRETPEETYTQSTSAPKQVIGVRLGLPKAKALAEADAKKFLATFTDDWYIGTYSDGRFMYATKTSDSARAPNYEIRVFDTQA